MTTRVFKGGFRVVAALGTLAVVGMFGACSAAGDNAGDTPYPGSGGGGDDGGGDATGGTGGKDGGTGGTTLTGGSAGTAGEAGTGGDGGTAGNGGEAGTAGNGGEAGTAGNAGMAGSGGDGGSGGDADAGDGAAGTGGSAGADAGDACANQVELCDGLDNNCNGQIDENNPGGGQVCTTNKPGVCAAGTTQCVNGGIRCVQNQQPSAEVCDGLDNNCDGNVDEGDPGGGGQCSTGLPGQCGYGVMHCVLGALSCQAINQPKSEVCNGLDDDCDGAIDNGSLPGVGTPCKVPGQPNPNTPCADSISVCEGGQIKCPQTYFAQSETCNAKDDDCNGTIDDPAAVNGQPCNTGYPGICATGRSLCLAGGNLQCQAAVLPGDKTELCNNKDDDCDGTVDDLNANTACSTQYPGAQAVNSWACTAGACEITSCASNYHDVNQAAGDGCECNMSTYAAQCASATQVSVPLNTPLANPITRTGGIGSASGSAWFSVTFAKPALGTPYRFRITLSDSHGSEFVMHVRTTCTNYATCTSGSTTESGQAVTTWEEATTYGSHPADDPAPPSQVYVQVTRTAPQLTCATFTIQMANY